MLAVLWVGSSSKRPAGKGASLELPDLSGLGHLGQAPSACPPSVYPAGAEYRFERCVGSSPVSWPRCSTVTYAVDPAHAPAGYRADLDTAVARLEQATRLKLELVGSNADITIRWDPSLYNPQPGTEGEAGVTSYVTENGISGFRAKSAAVRISSHLQPGTAPGISEEPVLLHELGHAVGLDHFSGPEVMNPMDRGFTSYQPGDLAGLAALYDPGRCQ